MIYILQHLREDDPDRQMEFCEWATEGHVVPGKSTKHESP